MWAGVDFRATLFMHAFQRGQDKWLFFYFISPSLYYQFGHFSIFIARANMKKLLHEFGDEFRCSACICVRTRNRRKVKLSSESLEKFHASLSCFRFITFRPKLFFLRPELKTSRNYFWPTQRTAEEQHVLLHPLRRSASIPLENFTNHLSLPHSSKSHFFFAFIFYSFTLCLSLQT